MKKLLKILLPTTILLTSNLVLGQTNIKDRTLNIGPGTAGDVIINAKQGSASSPFVKYNNTTSKWEKSDNGTTSVTVGDVLSSSASSTDNRLTTWDGTTGKSIQDNSVVTLSDAGVIAGLTGLSSSGTTTLSGALSLSASTTNSQVGSNVLVTNATSNVIRLTGATLTSLGGYAGATTGRLTLFINSTGADIIVVNEDTTQATATNRFITGTGGNVLLKNGASLLTIYNSTTLRHQVIGGTGSGSSNGTNLLVNGGFETGINGWTLTAGTGSQESSVVIEGAKSYKATLSAQTLELIQDSTTNAAQFADGVQGIAYARVKTSLSGISVCSRNAGVTSTNCASVSSDNKWMLYKAPFVMGGTSNGIAIVSSGAVTGDVYVDDSYVGTDAGITDVSSIESQSYVASITSTNAQSSVLSSVGSNLFTYSNVSNKARFTALKPITITVAGSYVASSNAPTSCGARISLNGNQISQDQNFLATGGSNQQACTSSGTAKLAKDEYIEFEGYIYSGGTFSSGWVSVTALDTPTTQLFTANCGANCVDVFSVKSSSTGVTSLENVDWINGNSSVSSGIYTYTFNSGIFTIAPNCISNSESNSAPNSAVDCTVTSTSSTQAVVRCSQGGTNVASSHSLFCQKAAPDFQASRQIVGSFKEVMTTPGVSKPKTCYYGFGGASATLASLTDCASGTCTELQDNCSAGSASWTATGAYSLTFSSGTFANNSYMYCDCQALNSSTVRDCHTFLGASPMVSNSTGGATISIYTTGTTGSAVNGAVNVKCEGLSP